MSVFTTIGLAFLAYQFGVKRGEIKASGVPPKTVEDILTSLITSGKLSAVDAQAIRDSIAQGADPLTALAAFGIRSGL